MDKQLIEKIALEVANSLSAPYVSDESAVRFATEFLARIDAERGKEAVAWFAFADNNGPVPLELWGFDKKECKHAVLENARSVGWKGTIEGYLLHMGWTIRPLGFSAPQPPAPCPNCCGQEPDDLHLRDEYMKAEREIKRLQAKVDEQILRCPDCKARANGYSVLVPSAELKKLQARVAELEADNQKRYGTIGELSQKVADQAAEIERMKSYADDADTCIKEAKTVIAQQAEQLASAIAAIKDAESLHRIDRNAYVGEIAQQAGRIAALEADNKAAWATADRHLKERNGAIERIADLEKQCEDQCISCKWPCGHKDQAALIEQCEAEFFHIKKVCLSEFGLSLVNENVLAAIAAHRGQS